MVVGLNILGMSTVCSDDSHFLGPIGLKSTLQPWNRVGKLRSMCTDPSVFSRKVFVRRNTLVLGKPAKRAPPMNTWSWAKQPNPPTNPIFGSV